MPENTLILTAEEVEKLKKIVSGDSVLSAAFKRLERDRDQAATLLKNGIKLAELRDLKNPEESLVIDSLNATQFLTTGAHEDKETWTLRMRVMQVTWAQNPGPSIPDRDATIPTHAWRQTPRGQLAFDPRLDGSYAFTGDDDGKKLVARLK